MFKPRRITQTRNVPFTGGEGGGGGARQREKKEQTKFGMINQKKINFSGGRCKPK
jgi:hypothetical protein